MNFSQIADAIKHNYYKSLNNSFRTNLLKSHKEKYENIFLSLFRIKYSYTL